MGYDGWMTYNNAEVFNLSRTVQLADVLGINTLWTRAEDVAWIQSAVAGTNYNVITAAPWYDAGFGASTEFAGLVPLSIAGISDSSLVASTTEYIGDGGRSDTVRRATKPLVFSVAIIAATERGAEFGKRWMDLVLADAGTSMFCVGANLSYFRYGASGSPKAHMRDVKLTRGSTVTRKHADSCSVVWIVTFTMTANDPYEYGETNAMVAGLGTTTGAITGTPVTATGTVVLTQQSCPVYDYSPLYDPLYPALIPAPSAPQFYPDGWGIFSGMTFQRNYARITPVSPRNLFVVPVFSLATTYPMRHVRISIWPHDSDATDQCDPLFSAVVSYLPAGQTLYVDGEQRASYVWDGFSPSVRRADSLVYSPDAKPVDWTMFRDASNFLVTVDVFADSDGYEGNGSLNVSLSLMRKSD